jgi:hypothetical protein
MLPDISYRDTVVNDGVGGELACGLSQNSATVFVGVTVDVVDAVVDTVLGVTGADVWVTAGDWLAALVAVTVPPPPPHAVKAASVEIVIKVCTSVL